jgi:hypothetical protein
MTAVSDAGAIGACFARSLAAAEAVGTPYPHWLLREALPRDVATRLRELPIPAPRIGDTMGKRETNNATRSYFSVENRARFPVCGAIADAFQAGPAVDAIGTICGARIAGAYLRIEYCQDTDGFWLEPHTDIGAKLFTLLIYLSDGPGAEDWGTDIYDADKRHVGRAPFGFNRGLIFIPGSDTWHGFQPRPIRGIRRSIIVNYVKDEWRAREQLSFPDRPLAAPARRRS